jgi:formamidopyrimidine-DNA glycosylase
VPELPEVETIARCLRRRLIGLRVEKIEVLFAPAVRDLDRMFLKTFEGERIDRIARRGKLIRLDFSGGRSLLVHLKMTGQLLFCPGVAARDKHTHFVISFEESSRELRFRDVRKFGFIRALLTSNVRAAEELSRLGPEPLALEFDVFRGLFRGRSGRIKPRLLDQSILAGIGNIYADEILFEARIHPQSEISSLTPRAWKRLWRAVPAVLRRAIRCRGTSVRDYRDGDGAEGGFQNRLRVYGREGLPCLRCASRIRRLRVSGRSSHFCPRCQRH